MNDSSPRTTPSRLGSSSSEVRRKKAPTRVTRGSFSLIAKPAPDVLGAVDHRAQLEQVELLAVLADAPLA